MTSRYDNRPAVRQALDSVQVWSTEGQWPERRKERRDPERQREREPSDPEPNGEGRPPADQPGLVAEPARPECPSLALVALQPAGRGLRLQRGVQEPRPRCPQAGRPRPDDGLAGLVARRLRPLRPAVH